MGVIWVKNRRIESFDVSVVSSFLNPFDATVTQLVECNLPKVDVVGSYPICRSTFAVLKLDRADDRGFGPIGRQ